MQRLADELAAEGLVHFIDNPKHLRSKLVQLTPKGERRYSDLNARFLAIASTLGVGLSGGDIRRARQIVQRLSDEVNARSWVVPSQPQVHADRRGSTSTQGRARRSLATEITSIRPCYIVDTSSEDSW